MDLNAEKVSFYKACESFFGRPVQMGSRATAAFIDTCRTYELFNTPIHMASDFDCFLGVIANSPACADILARKGLDLQSLLDNISTEKFPYMNGLSLVNYKALLNGLFTQEFPFPSGLTSTGKKVKKSGILTEIDILIGSLEAGRKRILPNTTVKNLLSISGISYDGYSDKKGDNFLLGIELECTSILEIDQSHSNQQFIVFIDNKGKLRLRPFGANVFGEIEDPCLPQGPFVFRGGVLQPLSAATLYSVDLIGQLEDMINSDKCSENDFQQFFESHPHLLIGIDFKEAHSQPVLYKDDGGRLIPDFFLEKIDSRWDAILDLKKPYESMVIRRPNRTYFKQWIQETISQLQYYREWFDSPLNRRQFEDTLNLDTKVFRPKMVIVAGRSHHFSDDVERMRLLSNQNRDLELWTYDDILCRAKRYNKIFS